MNDRTATARPAGDDPDWFLDDPELVVALVHWAMSKGAIIRRDWLGLPPRDPDRIRATGEPDPNAIGKTGLTRNQAAIALRRLGYSDPAQVRRVLHLAAELGQHLTAGHLVSFHGQDGGYDITPAAQVVNYASAASEFEAGWLRDIRDIAGEVAMTDAQVGARVRALLYPQHVHDDDGTTEGCPGCFPPGEVIGSGRQPGTRRPDGHELVDMIIAKHGVDRFPTAPAQYRHTADELGELGEAMMNLFLVTGRYHEHGRNPASCRNREQEQHVRKELGDLGLCIYGLAVKLGLNLDEAMAAVVRDERRSFAGMATDRDH